MMIMSASFRTEFHPQLNLKSIDHRDLALFLGSCFSENIGTKMRNAGFDILENPFGVIFNPITIIDHINKAIDNETFGQNHYLQSANRWFSYDSHSRVSAGSDRELKKLLETKHAQLRGSVQKAHTIFITFGTAWVYELDETGEVVANCHKQPQNIFTKRILEISEIQNALNACIEKIHALNPDVEVVLTVSPVRHLKDGFVENNRSKGRLVDVCSSTVENFEQVHYFPSYEWVIDELRDYRFFGKDMVHPNEQAVDFIWEKVNNYFFSDQTKQIASEIEKLTKAANHKPFQEDQNFIDFQSKMYRKCEELEERVGIGLSELKRRFLKS